MIATPQGGYGFRFLRMNKAPPLGERPWSKPW